jgi:subtilisin family serine protease
MGGRIALFFLVAVLGAGPARAAQAGSKIGPGVREALDTGRSISVMVALAEPGGRRAWAFDLGQKRSEVAQLQDGVLATLEQAQFRLTRRYAAVPALAGVLRSKSGLARLEAHPHVQRVDLNIGGTGSLSDTVPLIRADQWHALGVTGEGVVVAVLDSGVDTDHDDLADDLVHQECFLDTDGLIDGVGSCPDGSDRMSGAGAAEDDHGHGTNVTGIITSAGTVSSVGVAPDAGVVIIKVLNQSNAFFFYSEIIAALDFIIDNPQYGINVVNISLGTFTKFSGDCDNAAAYNMAGAAAVGTLRESGVLTFAATGNNGLSDEMASPACLSEVVSVGASNDSDAVANFTNSGSTLDLLAPGVSILSTGMENGLSLFSGTSQASPHAAACAALLIESEIATTPDDIESRMKGSPVSLTDPKNGLSFPRIDCFSGALPVAMAPMKAVADGNRVLLHWKTLSEVDNAGFEVQHKGDGPYEAVGFVEGMGATHLPQQYAFTTGELLPGHHVFRLKQLNFDGTYAYSDEAAVDITVPGAYQLSAAYPNPFNPATSLSLAVARAQHVRAEAFDVLGRRVAVLFEGEVRPEAAETLRFEATGLRSGTYLIRISGADFSASRMVVLAQ